jgi:DNA integrity scanning protein DisA with diadenylate cyclase activity
MTDFDDFEVTLYGKDIRLVVQNVEQALDELRRSLDYIEKLRHQLKAKEEDKVLNDLNSLFVGLKNVESKLDEIYRMHHTLYHEILRRQGE